ncbi:MAG: hypothetical protein ACLFP1_06825 [Candidatus Goldiibacteriota bacterium]
MRNKSIVLSLFIAVFVLLPAFFVSADDLSDSLDITWETVKEPFFDKFNPFGAGTRAIGMGEAFSSIADDAAAIYYNPSGLAQLNHNELHWTGGTYYDGVPYTGFAAFSMAIGGQYFGLSYMKLYHPIGRYPGEVYLPRKVNDPGDDPLDPDSLYYDPSSALTIPSGRYDWYGGENMGGLNASGQQLLGEKYREYINLPFQSNSVALTYATPLTGDKSFLFGLNVKYMFTDEDAKKVLGDDFDAWAWGLDLGFLYKLRVIEFLKDFNVGIMLRDVSGSIKRYTTGIEKNLYFTSTISISARTTELIEKEITSFSVDFDAVNDPGVFEEEKYRLKFGFEQWFVDGHFAVRGGLVNFLYSGPWRFSLGLSAKYWMGIDYAYVRGVPFGEPAEHEEESHWVSLFWEWGHVKRKLPTPDVFAAVEPISFAPRNGETAIFKLNAYSKAGIDRWALNILDKNNNLIKSYVDIGMPPSQIVWNGTDDRFQPLPDGEYVFIFEATDKLGSTSSTPVQTVKLYTPVMEERSSEALDRLKTLLNELKERDMAEDAGVRERALAQLEELREAKEKPTPADVPPAQYPAYTPYRAEPAEYVEPEEITENAAAQEGMQVETETPQGPVNMVGFPNIDSGAIRSAYITTDPDGRKAFNMEYVTENTLPKFVMREMALMVRSISESLGLSVDQIAIDALYGGTNTIAMDIPMQQAQNYSRGYISAEQLLRGAAVSLNGEAIYPNF